MRPKNKGNGRPDSSLDLIKIWRANYWEELWAPNVEIKRCPSSQCNCNINHRKIDLGTKPAATICPCDLY